MAVGILLGWEYRHSRNCQNTWTSWLCASCSDGGGT